MVDEPLRRRGLAREVIRQVQDLRKASGSMSRTGSCSPWPASTSWPNTSS